MLAVSLTAAVAVGLVATASGFTGAYFSDTKSGAITGTIGSVKITTWGGSGTDGLNLNFTNLMPGEPQTVTLNYQSNGTGPQDLYLTFPNVPALHALNNLGKYGSVAVADSASGVVFYSANLQDGRTRADFTNSCGSIFLPGGTPPNCWPLPPQLLVRSNLAPGASGSVTFTFSYAGKLTGNGPGVWNAYPASVTGGEAFGADAAGTPGNGLPFNVVATQVGQTP